MRPTNLETFQNTLFQIRVVLLNRATEEIFTVVQGRRLKFNLYPRNSNENQNFEFTYDNIVLNS